MYCKQSRIRLETIMIVVVVAKTCTGLPRINGVMENITANLGDKVGQNSAITPLMMIPLLLLDKTSSN